MLLKMQRGVMNSSLVEWIVINAYRDSFLTHLDYTSCLSINNI